MTRRAGEVARRHCEGARDELLALLELNRRNERLAGEERGEIVDDELAERIARRLRAAAGVRRQHDVVERQQRFRHVRLGGEHVEARAGDTPVDQCVDEIRLVDHRAARDVDEIARRRRARRSPRLPTKPRVSARPGIATTRNFTARASSAGLS